MGQRLRFSPPSPSLSLSLCLPPKMRIVVHLLQRVQVSNPSSRRALSFILETFILETFILEAAALRTRAAARNFHAFQWRRHCERRLVRLRSLFQKDQWRAAIDHRSSSQKSRPGTSWLVLAPIRYPGRQSDLVAAGACGLESTAIVSLRYR